jgi:hypothetical protein
MAPRFDRYERVFHRATRKYGTLIAPGPSGDTVLMDYRGAIGPVYRHKLRRLHWWERLLNR